MGITPEDTLKKERNQIPLDSTEEFTVQNAFFLLQSIIDELEGLSIQEASLDETMDTPRAVIKICMTEKSWIFICTVDDEWIDLKACFDKPAGISKNVALKCLNSWNANRRFSRMTIDEEDDLWLRADLPVSHGNILCLKATLTDTLHAFGIAMLEYQGYILSLQQELTAEGSNIETSCQTVVAGSVHECEKCALCLEPFKSGETLLVLPCHHFFHKNEVERHLYNNPQCPHGRSTI